MPSVFKNTKPQPWTCIKCHGNNPRYEYFGFRLNRDSMEKEKDYLKLTCSRCSYTWHVDCFDSIKEGDKNE